MAKVDRGNFRFHVHLYGSVLRKLRVEGQPDAEFAKLNRDSAGVAASLQDRYRELAPDEKAGFLAICRHQVGLRQNLQHTLRLKVPNECTQIQVRPERK